MMTQSDPTKHGWLKFLDHTGYPLLIARAVLGGVFISMGISKVGAPVDFLKLLNQYDMFPSGAFAVQNFIALTLPWIEVLCGVLLLLGLLIRGASLTLLLMLTVFTIVIAIRAIGIYSEGDFKSFCDVAFDCGCGGGPQGMCKKLPENLALWVLCWVPLLSASRRFCLAGVLGKSAIADDPDCKTSEAQSPPSTSN
ncbi:MAG: DoxX family membrane protein [Planctomycetes bacterium]|nr:DoxX family membrane protein [Planctomycetota bacterium]